MSSATSGSVSSASKPRRSAISSFDGRSSLAEEAAQEVAGLRAAPPVGAHVLAQVRAKLGGPDGRPEVVGRIEVRVHVGEVPIGPVREPGRLGQSLRIARARSSVFPESRPELELEMKLGDVPPEHERFEEARRLGVLARVLGGETEVPCMPFGLADDALDRVRVDLGQGVVAGELAEGIRKRRVAAREVESVTGFVQEPLVVLQAALRAGDEVDDRGRVGRDHGRARRLLRAVLEVDLDVGVRLEVEAELAQRRQADVGRPLLRVRVGERGEAVDVGCVVRRRLRWAVSAEEAVEPARAHVVVRLG